MCERHGKTGEWIYMIYGRQDTRYQDAPHIQQVIDGQLIDFYAWFELRMSKKVRLVYVWHSQKSNASGFEPLFKVKIEPDAQSRNLGSRNWPSNETTIALASYDDEGNVYAIVSLEEDKRNKAGIAPSKVLIAPGVDPGMVLAIAICLSRIKL